MNWTIYGMECVGALILFTCLIMISLCKNPVWWIHDYPKDIQEKYFETHERIPTEVLSASVFLKKGYYLECLVCGRAFSGTVPYEYSERFTRIQTR